MSLQDWVVIIAAIAGVYLAWQQNQIFKQQNQIFATQAGQTIMPPERFHWIKRYWPTLIMVALFLLGVFDIYDRHSGTPKNDGQATQAPAIYSVASQPTYIRLQFNAPGTLPVMVDQGNVWRWYTLKTITENIDTKTKKVTESVDLCTVFLTFDKPVTFRQVQIDAGGASLPRYEVKDSSQRSMIVVFSGDLSNTVVDIRATD